MDFVAKTAETSVFVILEPTKQAFKPLLEKVRSKIESTERKTFKYGSTDRHQLDVYYPPKSASKPPVLVFTYGGGYFAGDRVMAPPDDLVYRNVGTFFAERGFLTVIADYRLVPNAVFPQPSEDIRDAVAYIVNNLSADGDIDSIFLVGHSAGAAILATLFLHEPVLGSTPEISKHIKGIALMGGAYGGGGLPPPVIKAFFGESLDAHVPFGLLKVASSSTLKAFPPTLLMRSEKEPEDLLNTQTIFASQLGEKLGQTFEVYVAKGHNHISPHLALCTGEGEEWAEHIVTWAKARL